MADPAADGAGADAAPAAARWHARLLGGLAFRCGDIVVDRFPSRAVGALAARLAMAPGAGVGRETLVELLWPGVDATRGANRLRNALSTLRGLIATPALAGHAVLRADRRSVHFHAGLMDSDVAAFERAAAARDSAAARAAYGGELLPGFHDEWVEDERRRLASRLERLDDPRPDPASQGAAGMGASGRSVGGVELAVHAWRSLPRLADSFHGREAERAGVAAALQRARLVVITGPAGAGKSRLAQECAHSALGFDVVAWVPLLACPTPAAALEHVRAALGLQAGAALPMERIAARLDGQRALLVLDNLEHLLSEGRAPFIAALLERLPRLTVLATSQHALRRPAAQSIALGALPWSAATGRPGVASVAAVAMAGASPAVQLFVHRARARRRDFTLHPRNLADVLAVCELVQGLPLALELAAARIRQVPLGALGRSLGQAAGTQPGAAQPRHVSMAAALHWSWALLTPARQADLTALAVLRGAFDATAAAALMACRASAAAARLEALRALSLVQRADAMATEPADLAGAPTAGEGPPRWSLLSVLRHFAESRTGTPVRLALRARHRRHFLARAEALARAARPVPPPELPDMLHALDTALDDADLAAGAALARALHMHFTVQGTPSQALDRLRALARASALPPAQRHEIGQMLAALLLDAGRANEALLAAQSLRRSGAGLTPRVRLAAELTWVQLAWRSRRDAAEVLPAARAALAAARREGDGALLGRACGALGAIVFAQGPAGTAEARALFEEAERLHRAAGDPRAELSTLPGHLACLLLQGEVRTVLARGALGVAQAGRSGDVLTEVLLLNRVAEAALRLRRHREAVAAGRRGAALAAAHGLAYHLVYALWNLALPLARSGDGERAALLMAYSHRAWSEGFGALDGNDEAYVQRVRRAAERDPRIVAPAHWPVLWSRGTGLGRDEAVRLALEEGPVRR